MQKAFPGSGCTRGAEALALRALAYLTLLPTSRLLAYLLVGGGFDIPVLSDHPLGQRVPDRGHPRKGLNCIWSNSPSIEVASSMLPIAFGTQTGWGSHHGEPGSFTPGNSPIDTSPSLLTFGALPASVSSGQNQRPEGFLVIGFLLIVVAIAFAAMGAPGFMVLFEFLFSLVMFAGYFIAKSREQERIRREEMAAAEAREQLRNEVSEAVKETLKGAIKVRCRYCGSLNEENSSKCESCGGSL